MSSTQHRRVWVNLWDSSGAGYKGAMADFVTLPEDAIVADLRKAVKLENPNKLASIDVSNLAVYRDAAHFHARETEGPLRASTPLKKPKELEETALGASEDEALIVLVPSPSVVSPMEVDEPAWPPFDPSSYKLEFPFFSSYPGEDTLPLIGRQEALQKLQEYKGKDEKYCPFIISTSRGMGKTFFLKAVGSQRVPDVYKNERIQRAIETGRILSHDFREDVPLTPQDAKDFPTLLMIFFLCRLFDKSQVDGIHFQRIGSVSGVKTFVGNQNRFCVWLSEKRTRNADYMIEEYMRLTNLAFRVEVDVPPVFLLDEIQKLCVDTEEVSMLSKHHTLLTLLLTRLSFRDRKPICICAGTNDGNILDITDTSSLSPRILHLLPLAKEIEYTSFWEEMTRIENESRPSSPDVSFKNADGSIAEVHLFNALVYASCQVPRLLRFAHEAWFERKLTADDKGVIFRAKKSCVMAFENKALEYYSEMKKQWAGYTDDVIARIILACGVHLQATAIHVPGTDVLWSTLVTNALVFPYQDNSYVLPVELIWSGFDGTERKAEFKSICSKLIKNLDIDNLFMPYNALCDLSPYTLGARFEHFFVSSLAVKFYLCSLGSKKGILKFKEIYDFGHKETDDSRSLLEPYTVDFSGGIDLPQKERFVDSPDLSKNAIIHNIRTQQAHHDIILPLIKNDKIEFIPVSVKASFEAKFGELLDNQRRFSKKAKHLAPLLIWVYLGSNENSEKKHSGSVAFLNGSGCCGGLSLKKFSLLKKMLSTKVEMID